jgi:class 3 adenylate cyclase
VVISLGLIDDLAARLLRQWDENDRAAIGTVSNVASRLCDEAKPGQILISPRVLMAIEDAVRDS